MFLHAGEIATASLENLSEWLDSMMYYVNGNSERRDSRWYYGSDKKGPRGIQRSHILYL